MIGPVTLSVAPLEPKRPPATVVFWTKTGPEKVEEPEEAVRKTVASPTRPEAFLMLTGFEIVRPPSSWNWAAELRLTTFATLPSGVPVPSTRKLPEPPMFTVPTKSLAPFFRISMPGPTLVRPILPVTWEPIAR